MYSNGLLVTFDAWFCYFCTLDPYLIKLFFFLPIVLGAFDEATVVFGEAATICIKKQYLAQLSSSQSLPMSNVDHSLVSTGNFGPGSDDNSPRQLKHMHGNSLRDIPVDYYGAAAPGGAATLPSIGCLSNICFYNTPSPMASQVK